MDSGLLVSRRNCSLTLWREGQHHQGLVGSNLLQKCPFLLNQRFPDNFKIVIPAFFMNERRSELIAHFA